MTVSRFEAGLMGFILGVHAGMGLAIAIISSPAWLPVVAGWTP